MEREYTRGDDMKIAEAMGLAVHVRPNVGYFVQYVAEDGKTWNRPMAAYLSAPTRDTDAEIKAWVREQGVDFIKAFSAKLYVVVTCREETEYWDYWHMYEEKGDAARALLAVLESEGEDG